MKHIKTSFRAAQSAMLIVALGALMATPALADDAQKLSVMATVAKRATLKVLAQPTAVVVSAADVQRGYVDVPVPAHVAVQSNSVSGYLLEFASHGNFMKQTVVKGLANDVQVGPSGGAVMQPSDGAGVTKVNLALGFRFMLAESTQHGTYPWPMQMSVSAL